MTSSNSGFCAYLAICHYVFHTSIFVFISYVTFSYFTFDNEGMRSSKRQVTFLSLIFLLKCLPKSTTIF